MDQIFTIAQWLLAVPIGVLFALCIIGNWGILLTCLISMIFSKKEYSSSFILPYLGPFLGIAFFVIVPIDGAAGYWWTSFILDPIFLIVGIACPLSWLIDGPPSIHSSISPYIPQDGTVFHTISVSKLADVANDLGMIVAFLQNTAANSRLERFRDWWEHDGLHFPDEDTDFRELIQLVTTPDSIAKSMTDEHRVFIAFSPHCREWYLRFHADLDDEDAERVGEYSISLGNQYSESFSSNVVPHLKCTTTSEDALAYFEKIEA